MPGLAATERWLIVQYSNQYLFLKALAHRVHFDLVVAMVVFADRVSHPVRA